jgi:hypothetical protein
MRSEFGLQLLIVGALTIASAAPGLGQAAGIVRPSVVSDSTRQLRLRPVLAGFQVGEKLPGALARLGPPTRVDTLQSQSDPVLSIANQRTGITLIASRHDGVAVVLVSSREAGDLDSIRVGDSRAAVLARWGPPAASSTGGALWLARKYVAGVEYDDEGRVTRLVIGFGR